MAKQKARIGIIGFGGMAKNHYDTIKLKISYQLSLLFPSENPWYIRTALVHDF